MWCRQGRPWGLPCYVWLWVLLDEVGLQRDGAAAYSITSVTGSSSRCSLNAYPVITHPGWGAEAARAGSSRTHRRGAARPSCNRGRTMAA